MRFCVPSATRACLALVLAAAATIYVFLTLYEYRTLGWYPVREEPAAFSLFHSARIGFSALVAASIVATLSASPWRRSAPVPMPRADRMAACATMTVALAVIALFLADPLAFHALSLEDRPVENISVLALFLASAIFAAHFLIGLRRRASPSFRLEQLAMLAFAVALFVIAMEEISWMQRMFDYRTPGPVAQLNWQSEFNLHNMQTDLTEAVYYTGSALFLILTPLIAETVPDWGRFEFLRQFAPGRAVAAVAAPLSIFNFGHWNLVPIQVTAMLAPLVLIAFARMAAREGDTPQSLLLNGLSGAVVGGQLMFLALGSRMVEVYDATEYKELFIALGFGWYAIDWALRAREANTSAAA